MPIVSPYGIPYQTEKTVGNEAGNSPYAKIPSGATSKGRSVLGRTTSSNPDDETKSGFGDSDNRYGSKGVDQLIKTHKISKQYTKTTPEVIEEEVDERPLIELTGEKVEAYKKALDLEFKADTITVDGMGYSHVAMELGQSYMGNRIAFLTPSQGDAPIINTSYSFASRVAKEIFEKSEEWVNRITPVEPLIGEISTFYAEKKYESDLLAKGHHLDVTGKKMNDGSIEKIIEENDIQNSGLYAHVIIESPSRYIRKIKDTVQQIENVKPMDESGLDLDHLLNLADVCQEYNLKGFNLDESLMVKANDALVTISNTKVIEDDLEVYILESKIGKPFIVYFGDSKNIDHKFKVSSPIELVDGSDRNVVVDKLIDEKMIEFVEEAAKTRMKSIEKDVLTKHGYELMRVGEEENVDKDYTKGERLVKGDLNPMEYYRTLRDIERNKNEEEAGIGSEWKMLREVVFPPEEGGEKSRQPFAKLPIDKKLPFIKMISRESLVNEVLARVDPTNYLKNYAFYDEGFKSYFTEADEDMKKTIITKVTDLSTESRSTELDSWMKDNHTDLWDKAMKAEDTVEVTE